MNLIDRYVHAVAGHLPKSKRDEVSRELRSSLLDELEDRFGPDPSEEDTTTVLRELGPPDEVAASYLPSAQYLIGPGWFPTFRRVVRVVLTVLVVILLAAFALSIFTGSGSFDPARVLGGLLESMVETAVYSFGIIVLIFYALERLEVAPERRKKEWDPRKLPEVTPDDRVGRIEAVAGIAVPAVFLVLLHGYRDRIGIVVEPGGELLLNDLYRYHLPWLSAAILFGMAHHALLLWEGRWRWYTRVSNLLADLFGLWVFYRIATDVAASRPELASAGLPERVVDGVVQGCYGFLAFVAVILLIDNAKIWYRGLRNRG
jgi:hypothetical protein